MDLDDMNNANLSLQHTAQKAVHQSLQILLTLSFSNLYVFLLLTYCKC